MKTTESNVVRDKQFFADIEQIKAFLPHRPPFLLVDRVENIVLPKAILAKHPPAKLSLDNWKTEDKVGTLVEARKCVSYNEPFFMGHFPHYAIMPGVLVIEALAQAASFTFFPFVYSMLGTESAQFSCILAGVNKTRFRKPVVPGDVLVLKTEVVKNRGDFFVFSTIAEVENQVVAEAEIWANLTARI